MADATPGSLGYRWPAEWEPHAATWMVWPHNPDTWPGCLERARAEFASIVGALCDRERVHLLVHDAAAEDAARAVLAGAGVDPDRGVRFEHIESDDSWARDTGPLFLVAPDGGLAAADFRFDSWGRKYPPWDRDAAVGERIAARRGVRRFAAGFVLEGGAVDGNGAGSVLTTESCLLDPNRGEKRTRDAMEARLADWLGARQVLWLAGGIEGDDTDGHVDDVARFVGASTVVAAVEPDAADANHAPLAENLRRLRASRTLEGKPLDVMTLPMPPRQTCEGQRSPASYANFYLANGVALVPTFGAASDATALASLREVLPGRDVLGVPCAHLVVGLGAVHCLTQQEPA